MFIKFFCKVESFVYVTPFRFDFAPYIFVGFSMWMELGNFRFSVDIGFKIVKIETLRIVIRFPQRATIFLGNEHVFLGAQSCHDFEKTYTIFDLFGMFLG